MTPLRLVLVSPRFWPLMDEAGDAMAQLAVGLAARGEAVTVLTSRATSGWPAEFACEGVRVIRSPQLPRRGWQELRYVRWINQWLAAHAAEIDLACVSTLRYEAYATLAAARKGGFPVLLRAETAGLAGDCHWQLEAPFGRRVKRSCFEAAACVAPNAAIERELIAAGYPRQRIHLLPNGTTEEEPRTVLRHAEARAVLAAAHPALALLDESPMVLFAGSLTASKGLSSLVAAWPQVLDQWPKARLWLAGDGPLASALTKQIRELFLGGAVQLVGTFDDISELLAAADIFVLPSLEEGSSAVLLRAMSAALPVIASDVPSNAAIVRHEMEGLLVPPGCGEALTQAIVRLLAEPSLELRLGTAARRRADEEFSLARMVDRHLDLCRQLTVAQLPLAAQRK